MAYPPQEYRREIGQRVAVLRKKYRLDARPPEAGKKCARQTEQLTMAWAPASGR